MSDNHEHNGGHELENIDSTSLLAQMIALFVVVFIAVIAVAQWFYKQRDELALERAKDGYAFAKEQRAVEDEMLQGIDETTKAILKAPNKKLKAAKPPAGWIHPDDLAGGGAGAAPPALDADALVGDDADAAGDGESGDGGEKADTDAEAAPGDKPAEAVKAAGEGGAVADTKAEPAKAEPAKAEPAKAEPAKSKPAKAEGKKNE